MENDPKWKETIIGETHFSLHDYGRKGIMIPYERWDDHRQYKIDRPIMW